ncbi:MAG: MarR family transcriptional regulator [Lentisphaerae bacterium]|nr:MarR family transcriptional regulator [Lentisphaerota bacterium]
MTDQRIRDLRRNMRLTEMRIKEFCAQQVPTEIFHYTLSQMRAIDTLYTLTRDAGSGIQLKVLAENLAITPAAASEMVDTLVRKGAIIRKNDPNDRRAVRLYVGESLQARFEECESQLDDLMARFLGTLPASEVEVFEKVIAKFSDFTADPTNFPEVEK